MNNQDHGIRDKSSMTPPAVNANQIFIPMTILGHYFPLHEDHQTNFDDLGVTRRGGDHRASEVWVTWGPGSAGHQWSVLVVRPSFL